MTEARKRAARLREMAERLKLALIRFNEWVAEGKREFAETVGHTEREIADLIAGAAALEAQGRWLMTNFGGQLYMIPAERNHEWMNFRREVEQGEYSSIVPDWAVPVSDDVVITGWVR